MDLSKYPFEKLFGFIAGVIPGFIALLIFQLARPGSFGWFFNLCFLGYKTKLSLILVTAFVVGNTMTTFLDSFLGGLGGAFGGLMTTLRPYQPAASYAIAPWRDPNWRMALQRYLGAKAPKDTRLMSAQLLALKRKQIESLPEETRPEEVVKLDMEKLDREMDDNSWEQWYAHYHSVVLFDYQKREADWWVRRGLNFNMETAALYTLVSAFVVRGLRHWWIILPACMWLLLLIAEQYASVSEVYNRWSSLSRQIHYLIAQEPLEKRQ
jgi:hypothetical protein